jgi:hypothetical protein
VCVNDQKVCDEVCVEYQKVCDKVFVNDQKVCDEVCVEYQKVCDKVCVNDQKMCDLNIKKRFMWPTVNVSHQFHHHILQQSFPLPPLIQSPLAHGR